MSVKPRTTPEADLAFLRSVVEGGGRPQLTMGVAYLAGGALYGLQCLFHIGQMTGAIRWPDLANLAFVVMISVVFAGVLVWAIREDKRTGTPGPMATRAMNGAFGGAGLANTAMVIIFGVGAARADDFAIWLYYPAVVFGLQGAAWYMAWSLKRKPWMMATAIGGWLTAVALGLLVRDPAAYLGVCTAALFILFCGPGWIMVRDARAAATTG